MYTAVIVSAMFSLSLRAPNKVGIVPDVRKKDISRSTGSFVGPIRDIVNIKSVLFTFVIHWGQFRILVWPALHAFLSCTGKF